MIRYNNANSLHIQTPLRVQQLIADNRAISSYLTLNALGRMGRNLEYSALRNIVSVGIPTAVREAMRRGPLAMLASAAPNVSLGLAVGSCVTPILLEIIGLARDRNNGNQTAISVLARVLLIMAVGTSVITTFALGALPAAAPALIAANLFYTPLRDISQYFVQLRGGYSRGTSQMATGLSAATYFFNQLVVNFGMDEVARALEPALGEIVSNMGGRALVNIAGETADEMVSRYLNEFLTRTSDSQLTPTISLGLRSGEEINITTISDQLLNVHASRSSLFATVFNVAYSIPSSVLSNIASSASAAIAYIPFIKVASQTTMPDLNDAENGQCVGTYRRTSSQSSFIVEVIDERRCINLLPFSNRLERSKSLSKLRSGNHASIDLGNINIISSQPSKLLEQGKLKRSLSL